MKGLVIFAALSVTGPMAPIEEDFFDIIEEPAPSEIAVPEEDYFFLNQETERAYRTIFSPRPAVGPVSPDGNFWRVMDPVPRDHFRSE